MNRRGQTGDRHHHAKARDVIQVGFLTSIRNCAIRPSAIAVVVVVTGLSDQSSITFPLPSIFNGSK
jgi:hypothetical protein